MRHIKLQISSINKNKEVLNILNKFKIKFVNNYYVIEDKLFSKFKKEISNLDLDLSIIRNPDYVIIKEKMTRETPTGMPKWFKEWSENQFKPLVNKVNALDTKITKQGQLLNTVIKVNKLKIK